MTSLLTKPQESFASPFEVEIAPAPEWLINGSNEGVESDVGDWLWEARNSEKFRAVYDEGDISRWEEVARAHGEIFKDIRPAATLVEVRGLIEPELLVEIEVTAVIGERRL